jgi:signal transduction histidine kinase
MPPLPAELDRLLHDLRGPLNSAVMHLEVLRRAPLVDPGAKQSVDTLAEQLQRLAAMLPAAFDVLALELDHPRRVDLRDIALAARDETDASAVVAEGSWP